MSVINVLGKGAFLGLTCGTSLAAILSVTKGNSKNDFAKSALAGMITGVALAAIGHFGGQAAAIGAAFGAFLSFQATFFSAKPKDLFITSMFAVAGASVGYALGLIR